MDGFLCTTLAMSSSSSSRLGVHCTLAKNMGMLITFRFLAGFAAVAAVTCGSGTIADLMPVEKRGRAMAFWALGPIVGPVVGGVLIQHAR